MTLIIAITMAAWLAISNHCALTAAPANESVGAAPTEEPACPFHAQKTAPAKPKPAKDSPCCKILRAIVGKKAAGARPVLFEIAGSSQDFAILIVPATPDRISLPSLYDHGPPGSTFAELILQQSLLAHAPPVLG